MIFTQFSQPLGSFNVILLDMYFKVNKIKFSSKQMFKVRSILNDLVQQNIPSPF
jgi:hypothetical protein